MFQKAKPIFPKGKSETLNIFAVFRTYVPLHSHLELHIAAADFYRVFVNGRFLAFGPARTAKGYAREDVIPLSKTDGVETNEIVIEVAGYHNRSLSTVQQPAYLLAEITSEDKVNEAQPKLARNGIWLGYHNHAQDFRQIEYGAMIHRELEEKTQIGFEIDTYWAYVAGLNPISVLDRLNERIPVIHLKDGTADGHGKPLGMGTAPVLDIHKHVAKLGKRMIVESETCSPNGITEARICMDHLKTLR